MICFKLDNSGDVVIQNNNIQMIDGDDLIRQTCKTVLGTYINEWILNYNEGVNYRNILKKNVDFSTVRSEIYKGLLQVDKSFVLKSFICDIIGRSLHVAFVAVNQAGVTVKGEQNYGE